MYLFNLVRRLFRPSNIGTLIFFLLNAGVLYLIFSASGQESLTLVCVLYLVSILLAFSSFGEWVLSIVVGARRMRRVDMRNRVVPILERVYAKAKAATPSLSDVIILKVMNDPNPNAFAIGRRTVCVTEGLLGLPDEMIEDVLAHEIGHLALQHTAIQLLIGGGNIIITAFILVLRIISAICTGIATVSLVGRRADAGGCLLSLFSAVCTGFIWLWTRFCMLFLMWSTRANEYEADRYAYQIGYGYQLCQVLDSIGTGTPQSSFLRALYSSHPETNDRIGALQELGVPYHRY